MSKNRKRKPINPIPALVVGDVIRHPIYGTGLVKQIENENPGEYEFFYYVDFANRNGDGTKVWLPKRETEETCKLVNGEGESIA